MIVVLVALIAMMWWQSRKAKQQQQERKDFRENLQPGTEIITIGGVIGKVVSVDAEYEEIVIDSEGSLMRFGFNAISREYTRPAYVHDDEVDEDGNPLPQDEDDEAQVPVDQAVIESSQIVETGDVETETVVEAAAVDAAEADDQRK
ncbi:preprotein translocase subunit YajC [Bifidobacterium phasiani]|uniref:Preprotein translocase subunit YajC n=1 Tax=Bifidobacterium phasiani TaxID=2834431 RepID=A0ABS6W850_9BIFI|nr:preprotein translocase subunit YajC [Bifidobacterium phasiani]MBW3082676.1 preprotein translocase subunit YajC [Bifidobacterium phasiani]